MDYSAACSQEHWWVPFLKVVCFLPSDSDLSSLGKVAFNRLGVRTGASIHLCALWPWLGLVALDRLLSLSAPFPLQVSASKDRRLLYNFLQPSVSDLV